MRLLVENFELRKKLGEEEALRLIREAGFDGIDYSYFSPDLGGDIYFPYSKRAYKSGKAKKEAQVEEVKVEEVKIEDLTFGEVTFEEVDLGADILSEIEESIKSKK